MPTQSGPFLTVRQWTEQESWPPLGGLRYLIFHAKQNGFDAAICRVGRTVLLDRAKVLSWIGQHGSRA